MYCHKLIFFQENDGMKLIFKITKIKSSPVLVKIEGFFGQSIALFLQVSALRKISYPNASSLSNYAPALALFVLHLDVLLCGIAYKLNYVKYLSFFFISIILNYINAFLYSQFSTHKNNGKNFIRNEK